MRNGSWVIGITGASGSIYGLRLCQYLLSVEEHIHLIVTNAGWQVLHEELDWNIGHKQEALQSFFGKEGVRNLSYHSIQHIGASIASGSFRTKGMVIAPCSMGTLSAIAHGSSNNLLERTADVMLKEGRKLILVPRETPLHTIHLRNMLTLSEMGVKLIPAMPGFYHKPSTLDEVINFMVGKILDNMDVDHNLYRRWGEGNDS